MKQKISIIAAYGLNNEIGKDNDLLWHLPNDFKWFVKHTKGRPIIMGRKTMESLPGKKPLKDRLNIVITSQETVPEGFKKASSIEDAIKKAKNTNQNEIFIIGGGQIYKQAMKIADKIYITKVHGIFDDANVFFPEFKMEDWTETYFEKNFEDEKHDFDYDFHILERK